MGSLASFIIALPERASDSLADVAAKVVSSGITGDVFSEKIEEMSDVEAGLLAHELVKHHKELLATTGCCRRRL